MAEIEPDPSDSALAACKVTVGPAAQFSEGFDANSAAGEFILCTIGEDAANYDQAWHGETFVLVRAGGKDGAYAIIDRGNTSNDHACEGYDHESLKEDESWTFTTWRDVSVELLYQDGGQAVLVVTWQQASYACVTPDNWTTTNLSSVWVRSHGATRKVAACEFETNRHDGGMVDCQIRIAPDPSGVTISIAESSVSTDRDEFASPYSVVVTRHYHQRGETFILEKSETNPVEP